MRQELPAVLMRVTRILTGAVLPQRFCCDGYLMCGPAGDIEWNLCAWCVSPLE